MVFFFFGGGGGGRKSIRIMCFVGSKFSFDIFLHLTISFQYNYVLKMSLLFRFIGRSHFEIIRIMAVGIMW